MNAIPSATTSTLELATTLVHHIEFDLAFESIVESIEDPAGAPIILALGVPGFGKTELARLVEEAVAAAAVDAMRADPNHVPVVRTDAFAPDAGRSFGWREAYLTILHLLGESGVELRPGDALDRAALLAPRGSGRHNRSNPQLQLDVIDALRFHGTELLIIDEIEHIAYTRDEQRFGASADMLKTIANETGVRILALGSYEGSGFATVSGQLIRRMRLVHLPRYRADRAGEYREYARVAAAMLGLIGYADDPAELIPQLYRQSLGAVGTTADLLLRSAHAWTRYGGSLLEGISRNMRLAGDLDIVAQAIVAAEKQFFDDAGGWTGLDDHIGLAKAPLAVPARGKPKTGRKPARRVGRRAPVRDLVGPKQAA